MPRLKKTVTTIEDAAVIGDENETNTDIDLESNAKDDIAAIIDKLDGSTNAKVHVQRCAPGKADFAFCCEMGLDDFKEAGIEQLSKRFGGGKYRLRFKDDNGDWAGSKTIDIDPRLKGELDQPPGTEGNGSKHADALMRELAAKETGTMGMMLQMMQMQSQQSREQAAAMAQQNQANLQLLITAMTQPKGTDWKQLAAIMSPVVPVVLKLIEGRSGDPTLKAIETMAKCKELFASGDGGGDNMLEGIIKQFGPVVAAQMAARQPQPAATEQSTPSNVVQLENPQLPAPQQQTDDPEMIKRMVCAEIRKYYPDLLEAAAADVDPQSFFDVITLRLRKAPVVALTALAEVMRSPTWGKELFDVDPLPYPKWFEELHGLFIAGFKEMEAGVELPVDAQPEAAAVTVPMVEKVKGGKR